VGNGLEGRRGGGSGSREVGFVALAEDARKRSARRLARAVDDESVAPSVHPKVASADAGIFETLLSAAVCTPLPSTPQRPPSARTVAVMLQGLNLRFAPE